MKLSASAAWDATASFFRRHGGLVIALALAFFALPSIVGAAVLGPAPVLASGMPDPADAGRRLPFQMVSLLCSTFGALTICRLVLSGGLSVGEAIRATARDWPAVLGLTGFLLLVTLVSSLPLVLTQSGQAAAGGLLSLVILPIAILLFSRLFLIQPAIAHQGGLFAGLRTSWRVSKGNGIRIFLVALVAALVILLLNYACTVLFGSLGALLGGVTGTPATGAFLATTLTSLVFAAAVGVLTVMICEIYRQLFREPQAGAATGA